MLHPISNHNVINMQLGQLLAHFVLQNAQLETSFLKTFGKAVSVKSTRLSTQMSPSIVRKIPLGSLVWCGLRGSLEGVLIWPSLRRGIQSKDAGKNCDFRVPMVDKSPAPCIPKGLATNSVARGENKDGVSGTSLAAKSMTEVGRGIDIAGGGLGRCAGILRSSYLSRSGSGLEAARLTVTGAGAGFGWFICALCNLLASELVSVAAVPLPFPGNSGTGGSALLSRKGVIFFSVGISLG